MTNKTQEWWWVSCNGPAVGLGPPWATAEPPAAYPTPEQWLGFPGYEEARKVHKLSLGCSGMRGCKGSVRGRSGSPNHRRATSISSSVHWCWASARVLFSDMVSPVTFEFRRGVNGLELADVPVNED